MILKVALSKKIIEKLTNPDDNLAPYNSYWLSFFPNVITTKCLFSLFKQRYCAPSSTEKIQFRLLHIFNRAIIKTDFMLQPSDRTMLIAFFSGDLIQVAKPSAEHIARTLR
eukprot:TRINITY_DN2780_c0_g1_i1.p1 TRINITY_DN2780_c0_g1~~TRINITY_DN2780_c0_g1_i1.p1  ORF type:complete len:111 (-),score=7.00 TRINITY_DN2780_c0_g1_i1:5-337(-)